VAGDPDELLTLDEVAAELKVSREALYRWRRRGTGPPSVRLPGGAVRIRRSALSEWLRTLQDPVKESAA
jgi:excisionase family DNA binding protein